MPYRLLAIAADRATGRLGWLRAALGAFLGVLLSGLVAGLAVGFDESWPWLMASLGASAVLVFVFPASPLAQPWPVLGGNLISAVIGLAVSQYTAQPLLAAPLALGLAIATMSLARCLHPPGGACALLGAIASPATAAHGWYGLLWPLALNVFVLIAGGWLYNNLTGHAWPHHPAKQPPAPHPVPGGYALEDLDAVLDEWDEVLDVSREDLDSLIRAVERRTQLRQSGPGKEASGRGPVALASPAKAA